MRAVIYVFACVSFVAGQDINSVKDLPKYDSRYDYLSVDAILENKRLVRNYVDCLINAKPCTPEGKALKRLLPEALRTKCVRCTESQKQTAVKVIRRLKTEYPEEWQKLASRWDPTGDFTRYFEEVLSRDNFNTIPSGNEIPGPTPPPPPTLEPAPASSQPTVSTSPQPVILNSTPSTPPPAPTTRRAFTPPPPPPSRRPFSPPPPTPTTRQPSSPPPPTLSPSTPNLLPVSTSPSPIILNRFGDDGELMVNGQPAPAEPQPPATRPTTVRPVYTTRPTQISWAGAASHAIPTRFNLRPTIEILPPYTTAITLIDQIGYKIIRTTELVTDILRNTVRAVVGR